MRRKKYISINKSPSAEYEFHTLRKGIFYLSELFYKVSGLRLLLLLKL